MRPTLLLLSGLLLSQGGLAAQVEYDLGPDVSNYQRFVLYPHLQKGFSALERGHRDRAIAEFEQARRLQPRNPVITLYLARAYERFGEESRALALAREQLAITPDDGGLLAFAEAVQRKHPLDPACKLLECKVARADRDLQDGDLVGLTAALADPALARSTEGMGLRRNLLQRALGEQNWALAQAQFAWFEDAGTLSQGERKQWVTMLLAQGKLEQAIALRRRLPRQDGELDLAIALALAKSGDQGGLGRYQEAHAPSFTGAAQEREWLQLAANNGTLTGQETLQFGENQGFYVGLMLPVLRREGRWQELDKLLAMAPAQRSAELGFELAWRQGQWPALAEEGRRLVREARQPMVALEQVSYRLQRAGQGAASRSALDAGDLPQARQWLNQYRAAGLPLGADYWRALARTQEDEQAIASLQRVIAMAPEARDYAALAQHQQRLGNKIEARDALHAANGLEPDNREYQLAYGYALLGNDERQAASDWLEGVYREGDTQLAEQLAYINQSLARNQKARDYASKAIDGEPPAQVSYDLRRLHEDLGRRWTVSVDAWTGTGQGTVSGIGGNAVAQSYAQTEVEYRLGDEPIRDGKTLSLYGRLYGSSQSQRIYHLDEGSPDDGTYVEGRGGNPLDFRDPTLGVGVRWKPFRSQALFFAAEELLPLNSSQGGEHDTLIRASASFLNDGKYSDEWHVGESGWWAQNLYLDAARYLRSRQTSLVADYRLSYHHKIHLGDTLEPYGHVQGRQYWNDKSPDTGYYRQDGETLAYSSGSDDYSLLMGGVGIRWNHWFGETRYDAWPHKLSLGIEYQRRLKSDPAIREIESGKAYDKDTLMMTMGVRW